MRFFIRLSYNGKNYCGWQLQDNASTVQKVLNEALSVVFRQNISTIGCGRTDTGVHAAEFFAHFDLNENISYPEHETLNLKLKTLKYRLNGILPHDISIHAILPVKDSAHARFNAVARTYKYIICRQKDPFLNDYAYYLLGELNIDLMNEASALMMQYSDFTSFSKLHSNTGTNICKISHAQWSEVNSSISTLANQHISKSDSLIFTITADRFLRNMVRAVVGTLIDVGREKISIPQFLNIIESKNRSNAGYSVPAHALFLYKVEYPAEIFIS